MSLVYSKEITGRDSELDPDTRSYTRVWRVRMSVRTDDAYAVSQALSTVPGFPKVGTSHPADAKAKCRRIRMSDMSPVHWVVSASYSSEKDIEDNPIDDPPVITWDGDEVQRGFVEDVSGEAVLTEAGEPYEGLEYDDTRMVVTIVANVAEIPSDFLTFRNVQNESDIIVDGILIPALQGRIKKIPISEVKERNDIEYRTLTIKIMIDERGWDKKVLHAGFREVDPDDTAKTRLIMLDGNTEPNEPWPLDTDGFAIAKPTTDNAVYRTYVQYQTNVFENLPGIEPAI